MSSVSFKVVKLNGHICYTGELDEEHLPTFLRGSGAYKIVYDKDGGTIELVNDNPRV
jgi:hypothetical protein